ncbi:MAG: hypothetical protein A3F11_11225 [Gammaproteobacteria bacterium RIFCSPHIGHO2_12_FULL_37_14]|nr:MAG: hypothetical protein A3F11_11225 [Gammaproteobacteria bacterium RIFCSPHIGHO2_12_FULL_37_14]
MNALSIYKTFDIVILPFPFTDIHYTKNRPAVIISSHKNFSTKSSHSIIAMITSTKTNWPLDFKIIDLKSCGLWNPSLIRMKLFCIDNRLIHKQIGVLSSVDQEKLKKNFGLLFAELLA